MTLEAGSAVAGTGLAGAMADEWESQYPDTFDREAAAPGIDSMAVAIVDYITANAEVEVTGVQSGGDTASGTIS